jgi:hypothetical protein
MLNKCGLWDTNARETPILDQAFQIFSIGRHSINRVILFARLAAEKKNIVVIDPNAVPEKRQSGRRHSYRLLE